MLEELLDEQIVLGPVDDEGTLTLQDERALRSAMIRIQQLARDAEVQRRRAAMIVETYQHEIATLEAQEAMLRSSIENYLVTHGGEKVRFPDVGTAYLGQTDAKIQVVDRDELKAAVGAMFTKETFDETAAKTYALEQALENGVIVPGTELVPATRALRFRKA